MAGFINLFFHYYFLYKRQKINFLIAGDSFQELYSGSKL